MEEKIGGNDRMNIVLTGPMGSGKTTVGKTLAKSLGMKFVDTDELVMKKSGADINEIFAKHGEEHFRELEEKVIAEVSKFDNYVIATGGGVVLKPLNMRRLRRNGIIVNLRASLNTLYKRLKGKKDRPLLNKPNYKKGLKTHLENRLSFYSNTDFIIETDKLNIKEITNKIHNIIKMPQIRVCACIAGSNPDKQIQRAVELGASLVELRLDLIQNPDIYALVQMSGLPVIATDRKNKDNLIKAIEAGCDLVDIEIESPEKEQIIEKARQSNCRAIVSMHNFKKTPKNLEVEKGNADILKVATKTNSAEDCRRLLSLLNDRDDLIVVGIGKLGTYTRVVAPLLGSYLTYASINKPLAQGQLTLRAMNEIYRRMGLK